MNNLAIKSKTVLKETKITIPQSGVYKSDKINKYFNISFFVYIKKITFELLVGL